MPAFMHVCINVCMHVCKYVYMYVVHVQLLARGLGPNGLLPVCLCVCVIVCSECIYMCKHTHTYMRTHIPGVSVRAEASLALEKVSFSTAYPSLFPRTVAAKPPSFLCPIPAVVPARMYVCIYLHVRPYVCARDKK